ncbi:MAG TPA: hypothetical protein VD908_10225 [Cytophagales bacterium]|nr:hypothetical protein [Cytophagales bacterium]
MWLIMSTHGFMFRLGEEFLPNDEIQADKSSEEIRPRKGELLLPAFLNSSFSPKSLNELPVVELPVFKKDTFNIEKYGAKKGISFNNPESIAKTIEACSCKQSD